jgi:hypothetical protein
MKHLFDFNQLGSQPLPSSAPPSRSFSIFHCLIPLSADRASWVLNLFILGVFISLFGCQGKKESAETAAKENSAEVTQRIIELSRAEPISSQPPLFSKKYVYASFFIEETKGYPLEIKGSIYVSKIIEVEQELNADLASRILDEEQDRYLNSIDAKINQGKVVRRGLNMYDTYADASSQRARELAK